MTGRRGGIITLAAVIALLFSGAMAGLARTQAPTTDLSAGSPPGLAPEAAGEPVAVATTTVIVPPAVDAPPTPAASPAATASSSSSAPPPPAVARAQRATAPAPGVHHDQPLAPGEVGSVADLGPGPVEPTVPAPCTPSSQPTLPHAIAVVELRLGCVRALVPPASIVGDDVSWSPDGTWLLATVQSRVVRLARDGSWRQDLGGGGQARSATLAPDGRHMVVEGSVPFGHLSQKGVVVVASADGTNAQVIDSRWGRPVWSPDSQLLALLSNDGGFAAPDTLHLVGLDGREQAHRTVADRAFWGSSPTAELVLGPALLGLPIFLADGRIFQPAFIEVPRLATGLWFNRSLDELAGPAPPSDLMFNEGMSAASDGADLVYTGAPAPGEADRPIRRVDLRTGAVATLAANGADPSTSHRPGMVAFTPRSSLGTPLGLSVVDPAGAVHPVWRHTGTNCTCSRPGLPAWTADDSALAAVT